MNTHDLLSWQSHWDLLRHTWPCVTHVYWHHHNYHYLWNILWWSRVTKYKFLCHKLARAKYFQCKHSLYEICSVSPLATNDLNKHWNILIRDNNRANQHQGDNITSLTPARYQSTSSTNPIPAHLWTNICYRGLRHCYQPPDVCFYSLNLVWKSVDADLPYFTSVSRDVKMEMSVCEQSRSN